MMHYGNICMQFHMNYLEFKNKMFDLGCFNIHPNSMMS